MAGFRFAIVVSRFNEDVTEACCAGRGNIRRSVDPCGGGDRLPRAGCVRDSDDGQRLGESGDYDAIVCLGCLIKGDTMHFEYIAEAASHGIQQAAAATGVPMAFGVLTTLTEEQAVKRSSAGADNKDARRRRPPSRWQKCSVRSMRESADDSEPRTAIGRPSRGAIEAPRARAAVQMLYQWEVGAGVDLRGRPDVLDRPARRKRSRGHARFATRLATGVAGTVADIDPMIVEAAENWRIERMNVLDRLILRLAIYEFLHEPGTPAKVVINEALELARTFSTDDSVRFINGILDAVRRTLARE